MVVTDSQKWLILASTVVVGWLIVLLAPVLTPFLISALLAYLGRPDSGPIRSSRGLAHRFRCIGIFGDVHHWFERRPSDHSSAAKPSDNIIAKNPNRFRVVAIKLVTKAFFINGRGPR